MPRSPASAENADLIMWCTQLPQAKRPRERGPQARARRGKRRRGGAQRSRLDPQEGAIRQCDALGDAVRLLMSLGAGAARGADPMVVQFQRSSEPC